MTYYTNDFDNSLELILIVCGMYAFNNYSVLAAVCYPFFLVCGYLANLFHIFFSIQLNFNNKQLQYVVFTLKSVKIFTTIQDIKLNNSYIERDYEIEQNVDM